MHKTENIIILGQGGQGVLKAAKLLAEYYFYSGKEVKTSTLIGLGVRGGGVYSHVKAGAQVVSPLIMAGKCDMIIGLEKLETIRCLDYLKVDGELVLNDLYIPPTTVSNGLEDDFTGDFELIIKQRTSNIHVLQENDVINRIGNKPVLNSFFLGVASKILGHNIKNWEKVLEMNTPIKFVSMNIEAFFMGYNYI